MGEPAAQHEASTPQDEELVSRYLDTGESAVLDALIQRYSPLVRRMVITLVGADADTVLDIEQEVFVALLRKLPTFRGDSRFATFFYRVARNRILDALRSRKRYRSRVIELVAPDERDGRSPDAGDRLVDAERVGMLRRAMERLTPEDRMLLYMKDGEGRSIAELIELVGMPEGTVKSRLARARQKVAHALQELGYEQ